MSKEELKNLVKHTFAWDLLGESGSPKEGEEELLKVLKSVYNRGIEDALDSTFSTIDDSRKAIEKLRIE